MRSLVVVSTVSGRMRAHPIARLTRRSLLLRGGAILFLVVAFADLALSGPCCEETFAATGTNCAAALDRGDERAPISGAAAETEDRRTDGPPSDAPTCPECFCSCVRMLPETVFAAD